ncbi:MAG: DUF3540 domain-containing protein [Polyangiaceae bacterium]
MSEVSSVKVRAALPLTARDHLGPASVTEVAGGAVFIELPDGGHAEVTMAMPIRYEPVPGDVLLVVGREAAFYAIGVLHGMGKVSLDLSGDVDLRASGGTLRLTGDKGVELHGPTVDLHGGTVRVFADSLVQKVSALYQRVSGLWSAHAQESHTVVDGTSTTKARSATVMTEETMTINGKEIHLG